MKFDQFAEFRNLAGGKPPRYVVQLGLGDVPRFVRCGAPYGGPGGRKWVAVWEFVDVETRMDVGGGYAGVPTRPSPATVSLKMRHGNSLRTEQLVFYPDGGTWTDMCERPAVLFASDMREAAGRFGAYAGLDFGSAEKAEAWFDLQFACMGLAADPDPGS